MKLSILATALSSVNIPTGLLWVSSAVFQMFVISVASVRQWLKLCRYTTAVQQNIHRGGVGAQGTRRNRGWHLNALLPPWRRAWDRVEVPKTPRGGCGVWGGDYSTTKADYVDKII